MDGMFAPAGVGSAASSRRGSFDSVGSDSVASMAEEEGLRGSTPPRTSLNFGGGGFPGLDLSALAAGLAPAAVKTTRDALRYGEEQFEQGLQQRAGSGADEGAKIARDNAGAAFLRAITACEEVMGDILIDSDEEEELEELIGRCHEQLDEIRMDGWSSEAPGAAGLPPLDRKNLPTRPVTVVGASSEPHGAGEQDEGRPFTAGMFFGEEADLAPLRLASSSPTNEDYDSDFGSESDATPTDRNNPWLDAAPWAEAADLHGGGGKNGPKAVVGPSWGRSGAHYRGGQHLPRSSDKSSLRQAFGIYTNRDILSHKEGGSSLRGPSPGLQRPHAVGARPTERSGGGRRRRRRSGLRDLSAPPVEFNAFLEQLPTSVEQLRPDLVTPRRAGWDFDYRKVPESRSLLRDSASHGALWPVEGYGGAGQGMVEGYGVRDTTLRHPRSAVNAFCHGGSPSRRGQRSSSAPRQAEEVPIDLYDDERPWRNSRGPSSTPGEGPVLFSQVSAPHLRQPRSTGRAVSVTTPTAVVAGYLGWYRFELY